MGNFIGMVFSTLKQENVDIKNMSIDDAIKKYNEITKKTNNSTISKKENVDAKSKDLTSPSKHAKIELPKQEYAQVAHALATKYANKSVKSTSINIGNTMYMVTKVRPGYFEVVDKIDIEEYRNLIDMLEGDDD